jgi:hypothetical protein
MKIHEPVQKLLLGDRQTGLFENKLKTMQYYVLYFDLQHKLKVTVKSNGSG